MEVMVDYEQKGVFKPSVNGNTDCDEKMPPAPAVPVSPGLTNPNPSVSPDVSTLGQPVPIESMKKTGKKKEVVRKKNGEEHAFFFLNIMYCFFFPYVCKIQPLNDDDIPEPDSRDSSEGGFNKVKDKWAAKYAIYAPEKEKFDAEKERNPKTTVKEPTKPGLIGVLLGGLGSFTLLGALFLQMTAVACQLVQPWLMKKMLEVVVKKMIAEMMLEGYNDLKDSSPAMLPIAFPDGAPKAEPFPVAYAVIIILMPFLHGFFDAWANRLFFHFSGQFRSTCCAMIYNKTLSLNITAQSNVNTGRILSLISSDCRMVGEMLAMMMMMFTMPFQVIVPLIFVIIELKWTFVMTFAVILVMLPFQGIIVGVLVKGMNIYLFHNDERNKVTNETFQGIRIVKYSGLESVFIRKIQDIRAKQSKASVMTTVGIQLLMAMMRAQPMFVNSATFAVFVKVFDIEPKNFAVDVMPSLGYLQQMTQPLTMAPMILQAISMLSVTLNRIRDYLVLPELKHETVAPSVNTQYAVSIRDGFFKWGPPPEIPLSENEKQGILKEKERREREAKAKLKKEKKEASNGLKSISSFTPSVHVGLPGEEEGIGSSSSSSSSSSSVPPSSATPSLSPIPSTTPTPELLARKLRPTLRDINMQIPFGSLTMVIGGVGSGKSSVGSALIGDIEKKQGEVQIAGSFAYCPQTAWINNNTVRGNITFGMPYEEAKYLEVVRVCALEPDFRILAAGDQTAIGEKGVNLSGGQKARIQLARAVYADRDIYILDDPLSAVDAHVGRYILEECICGRLSQKTRVLMTNQLQFLARADSVVLLNDGEVIAQGPYAELKEKGIDFSQYILKGKEEGEGEDGNVESQEEGDAKKEEEKEKEKEKEKAAKKKKEAKKKEAAKSAKSAKELEGSDSSSAQQIMTEEEQATQGVSWGAYLRYLRALFHPVEIVFFFLLTAVCEGIQAFASYWLGKIGSPEEFKGMSFWWKVALYVLLGVGILVLLIIRSFWAGAGVWRATQKIHDDLLKHVMKCPEVFFNTTPLGRILNRFSGDMTASDQQVFMMLMMVITIWLQLIGNVVIIAIDTVFFLYIGLPVLVVFYLLLVVYQRSSRNLQRIESISRSPVISLFGETVSGAGLSTIRAYHLEENWRSRFNALNDAWTVRFVLFREGQKWASMMASIISAIFMAGVILIGWYNMETANLAVAINASMAFGAMGVMLVQMNVELESNMTSLERILFYSTKLPQETDEPGVKEPPKSWPAEGRVEFDHVSFRYRPGLPYVLNDVSMKLNKGEKIGVCGRTGAGKSSLLFALFRLIELNPALQPKIIDIDTGMPIENTFDEPPNKGRVLIDGIDIAKVPLTRLRSSVSIIPQDPTLFTGTVRYNLDLPGRCTEDRIWEVLDMIQMRGAIAELPAGLDTQVAEGGSNFSCGQRQLLCFARAILNDCRIVIMDEATASVDVETDAKIQDTIKNQFKTQTVIVIAHRLNTILGSDRILVMDSGRVSEFDTPENLQNNPNSAFNGLLQSLTH